MSFGGDEGHPSSFSGNMTGFLGYENVYPTKTTFVTFPQKGLPSSLPSLPALRQEITEARQALEAMEPKVR